MIDTHAHLNDDKFANDMAEVIGRANQNGIEAIICCGYDIASSKSAIEMAENYDCVYATVGIHPHDAKSYDDKAEIEIAAMGKHPKVLAIGEIGLDYHYDFSPRDRQIEAFKRQMDLALNLNMPVVIHSRESNEQILEILQARTSKSIRGVMHCFSGDEEFAAEVLALGLYIGVDGPITYKASDKLRRVMEYVPLDRILIETDCPYLSPIPMRGKRNEPANLKYIVQTLADIKAIPFEEMAHITTANARALFGPRLV